MRAAPFFLSALLVSTGLMLGACDTIDNLTALLDTKKKLPGDRKPVFPEGVPGVSMGVPPEMMKGYHDQQQQQLQQQQQQQAQPAQGEKAQTQPKAADTGEPKDVEKPKPKKVVNRPKPKPA